jgi:hypothetical protein
MWLFFIRCTQNSNYTGKPDAEEYKQLKFTIGYSDIPEIVHFFHDQKYRSENAALKESIPAHCVFKSLI